MRIFNYFQLKKHNTTPIREFIAGSTTFFAMLYIIPVNATILHASGMPFDALVSATILMTVIATMITAAFSLAMIPVILTFLLTDIFDTIGT